VGTVCPHGYLCHRPDNRRQADDEVSARRNGEEEEDRSLPAPDSYQGDNSDSGEATGIAPVIRTIDRDGTERWFDLNGHQLSGKPTKKGVYIHRGKKQVVK